MKEFFQKNKKTSLIVLIAVAIVAVAVIAGCSIHNKVEHDKEVAAQQEFETALKAIEAAQVQAVNGYNDRVNNIVNAVLVPDAEGQNPSLENNDDVDAMVNAINELNNVTNDINNDGLLTQEQKDALNANITAQGANIDARVQAVMEARAKAEAEAAEKAAKAAAKKKAEAAATKKTTTTAAAAPAESSGGGGRTFVMIDIGSQRLYVLNGPVGTDIDACEIQFSTGIVTGSAGSADTPRGRYSIRSKQSGVTLRPSDGSTAYVDYWMPFIGNSIGIHDATWRDESEFGTDQYTISGSHGCVNLPHGAAATVWSMVSVGTPVIVV